MRRLFLPLLFGILGTVVLVSLGTWQLQRLTWKEGVIAEIDARIASAPVALPDPIDVERDKYLPVTASGTITEEEIHLLASTRDAGAVYRLVAAFETDSGRRIMIDRGWIKTADKDSARPAHAVKVVGNLHWPDERDSYTPANDVDGNIWFARDVDQMAEVLSAEPVLLIVREDTDKGAIVTPLPIDTATLPNNHLEYVLTWYGLAIVWVAMTLYYLRRMRKTKKA
ncbi:SURF1 family protein [Shimia sagamensis]|uniref:SURF1-like protein n=1 Tax=Shimia sagamensis TaxID=1566352 RepID=A0ABY1NYE8_9RHOB|nr:SURF1 family protein [Shimia sagamensis]SMP21989.1 surfeit locus 1 family protein [Shimia sagamensis]